MGKQSCNFITEERKENFEKWRKKRATRRPSFEAGKAQWLYEYTVDFAEQTIINSFPKTQAIDNFCRSFDCFARRNVTKYRTMANKKQYVLDSFFDSLEKFPQRWIRVLLSCDTRMTKEIERARRIYRNKATKEEIYRLVDKWFWIENLRKTAADLVEESTTILTNLVVSEEKGFAYLAALGYKLDEGCRGYLDKEKTINFRYEPAKARKPKKDGSGTIKPAKCFIYYIPAEQVRERAKLNKYLNPSYQVYEANIRELIKAGVVEYEIKKMPANLKKKYGEISEV